MYDFYDYNYSSIPYGRSSGLASLFGSALFGIVSFLMSLMAVLAVYRVICWIFKSIGLYRMAKQRGIQHAWWSWIPVLSSNIIGRLDNDVVVFGDNMRMKEAPFWLPIIEAIGYIGVGTRSGWGAIISFACWVVYTASIWRLFEIYNPKHKVSFTVLSVFLGSGFFIFACRDKKPFDPLFPKKEYRHYFAEDKQIREAQKMADDEIDAKADKEVKAIRDHYASMLEGDLTEEEKEELRRQRDDEVRAVLKRADEAKEDNAVLAGQFRKVAETAPSDEVFDQYVEKRAEIKREKAGKGEAGEASYNNTDKLVNSIRSKKDEAVSAAEKETEELDQDFKNEDKDQ